MRWLAPLLSLLLPLSLFAGEAPEDILKDLPKAVAGCEKEDVHTYPQPGLGASTSYRQNGLLITVYVYDLGHKEIGAALTDPVLAEAFASARRELAAAAKAGYYSNLEERDHGQGDFGKGCQTLRARYRLTRERGGDAGRRCTSEIHVFGARGQIIKLRITGDLESEKEHEKVIEEFIPKLMDAIRQPGAPKLI